jgi:hypothetical protein
MTVVVKEAVVRTLAKEVVESLWRGDVIRALGPDKLVLACLLDFGDTRTKLDLESLLPLSAINQN